MPTRRQILACATGAAIAPGPGRAQDMRATPPLRWGISVLPTSIDPHFHNASANNGILMQIFEPLLFEDADGSLAPRLAQGWRNVAPTVWEFTLRSDAIFHDGTPFTADDVVFSVARVPTIPNSPGLYTTYVASIERVEVLAPHLLRVHTKAPTPLLPRQLSYIMILSRTIHAAAATPDFNSGRMAIGTGPYRFVRYSPNEALDVAANPSWWGGRPAWSTASMLAIGNGSARLAALLSNAVDLIDAVPLADLASARSNPALAVFSGPSIDQYYLLPDTAREQTPFVRGHDGQPLSANPLRDRRIRLALSHAIDREALVSRMFEGQALAINQFASPAVEGYDPALMPPAYDPARAKALLQEAGLSQGFQMTLHGSQGWFAQDSQVCQAVAQFWTRIGVSTQVELAPVAAFLPKATAREYSMFLSSWSGFNGAVNLRAMLMTRDVANGVGTGNRLLYSNPALDEATLAALSTIDTDARIRLTRTAMRAGMDDVGALLLLSPYSHWAGRRGVVSYRPHANGRNMAMLATPGQG